MNLDYKITSMPGSLRTIHIIIIEAEFLTTTRADEVLAFAKSRGLSKSDWKLLKESVRLGEFMTVRGGASTTASSIRPLNMDTITDEQIQALRDLNLNLTQLQQAIMLLMRWEEEKREGPRENAGPVST